jgi:hypothetical protein
MLSEREIPEGANERIHEHRMGDVIVTVTDSDDKGEWWTQSKGQYRLRGFCGEYDVTMRGSKESFTLSRGENQWAIELA